MGSGRHLKSDYVSAGNVKFLILSAFLIILGSRYGYVSRSSTKQSMIYITRCALSKRHCMTVRPRPERNHACVSVESRSGLQCANWRRKFSSAWCSPSIPRTSSSNGAASAHSAHAANRRVAIPRKRSHRSLRHRKLLLIYNRQKKCNFCRSSATRATSTDCYARASPSPIQTKKHELRCTCW